MRHGFTLLELSCVIAVMGILAAVAVPTYDVLVRRARVDEVRSTLQAITHAEQRQFRDQGAYLACPATGPVPQGATPFPVTDCWRSLGIHDGTQAGIVRYRYSVTLEGASFLAVGEGDLDRDGVSSRYTLRGSNLGLEIENGLE